MLSNARDCLGLTGIRNSNVWRVVFGTLWHERSLAWKKVQDDNSSSLSITGEGP